MIIDCHYHLEERLLSTPDLIRKMDESEIDRIALMGSVVEPFHEIAPFMGRALQFILKRKTLRWMGERMSSNFNEEGNIPLVSGQMLVFYKDPDNDPVFSAVDAHPGRFLGWIFVNPRGRKDQKAETLRWIDHPLCVGIKAHPFWHRYSPVELAPAAETAASKGKPLLLHAGFGDHGNYQALLKKVPGLKLILAHTGFPRYSDAWRDIKDMKNVFVDLSQTTYISPRTIRKAVEYLGPDRCLYGTDGPFGFHGGDGLYDMGIIKGWIEKNFPDRGVRRRILGENFAEIVGIRKDMPLRRGIA